MNAPVSKSVTTLLSRLTAPFTGNAESSNSDAKRHPQLHAAYASVNQLNELFAEKRRLAGLIENESNKLSELNERLCITEARRIEALTEFRINGDDAAKRRADELLGECTAIRQELNDTKAISEGIAARMEELEPKIAGLRNSYRVDLAKFLNGIYVELAEQYNQLAPQTAEIVQQMAALHKVMLRYLAGNTNGFEHRAYLPACVPFEGRTRDPILDMDTRKFSDGANAKADDIMANLKSAGFIWRFD